MAADSPYYYVRDKGSRVAHHWDYARDRTDHALCGYAYQEPVWEGTVRPRAVCRACQELLPAHEVRWWRQKAETLQAELDSLTQETDALTARVGELENHVAHQRRELSRLQRKSAAQGRPGSGKRSRRTAVPDNRREAIARRLREEEADPLAAADLPAAWRTPLGRRRPVLAGLPGLGRRR